MLTRARFNSQFNIDELENLFSFKLRQVARQKIFSISTDSRVINENQIFLPLVGERFDGHDFINQVIEKGGMFSFCEKKKSSKVKEEHRSNLIVVENTLDSYHILAKYYLKKINPKIIAITGSSGKTTVKDLVSSVVSIKFKTHKSEANFNNEFGIPRTILEMPEDTQVLVLELAMRGRGEIRYLSKTIEPDIAVITNVGTAHIGRLGSTGEIIKAKAEILEYLKKGGLAVLSNQPELIQYVSKVWKGKIAVFDLSDVTDIYYKEGKTNFTLVAGNIKGETYSINALGKIHILNSLIAILVAKYLSVEVSDIQKGISGFSPQEGRGNVVKLQEGIFLIDETYNANPDSLKAAYTSLIECWGDDYKKVLVLGELAELGKHEEGLLRELGNFLRARPISKVITVGKRLGQVTTSINVENIVECCAILEGLLTPKTVVLIKGSHVAGLDRIVNQLIKTYG